MKNTLGKISQVTHKWLGLIVAMQLMAWTVGGAFFVIVPFLPIIKGEQYIKKIEYSFQNTSFYPLHKILQNVKNTKNVSIISINNKPVYKIIDNKNQLYMVDAVTGKKVSQPKQQDIISHAKLLYQGNAEIKNVQYVRSPLKKSLFIVDELGGRVELWQVEFNDFLHNRLYFTGDTGEFYKIRNDAWVIYDFFWRLHVMDYKNGENFNNPLVIIFTLLLLFLSVTGIILLFYSSLLKRKNIKK
jgi:hypothetical protein